MKAQLIEIQKKFELAQKQLKARGGVPEFPLSVFPTKYQEIITEISKVRKAPVDFYGSAVLLAASTAVGYTCSVVDTQLNWAESACIWLCLVGSSSRGKSLAMDKFAMQPIHKLQSVIDSKYRRDKKEFDKAVAEAAPAKPPIKKQLVVTSATMEWLIKAINNNPSGILFYKEELLGWIRTMNQYRNGDDEQKWISIFNHDYISAGKISDEVIAYYPSYVTVGGGIQPALLPEMAKDGKGKSGFLYRILFAYPAKATEPDRYPNKDFNSNLDQQYREKISSLFKLREQWSAINAKRIEKWEAESYTENINTPDIWQYKIPLSPDAHSIWVKHFEETKLRVFHAAIDDDDDMEAIRNRMLSYTLKLALLLELLYHTVGESNCLQMDYSNPDEPLCTGQVTARAMQGAITLIGYFEASAQKVQIELSAAFLDMQLGQANRNLFKVDWSNIFQQDTELPAKELVKRIQKIYPSLTERSCYRYFAQIEKVPNKYPYLYKLKGSQATQQPAASTNTKQSA